MGKVFVQLIHLLFRLPKLKAFCLFTVTGLVLSAVSFLVVPPVQVCHANAGPPPSILIIVPYAPGDMEISIIPDDIKANRTDRAFESYFTFYLPDLKAGDYTLRMTTSDSSYDRVIKVLPKYYETTYTLDTGKREFTFGQPVSRTIMLVSLRIILTLLLEGLVFWGFRYKEKRSWIVFIIVNLVTQGILNVSLDLSTSPVDSYIIFQLLFGEFLVFAAETALFLILVNEKSRAMTFLYVISANLLSLFAGGLLITVLPV